HSEQASLGALTRLTHRGGGYPAPSCILAWTLLRRCADWPEPQPQTSSDLKPASSRGPGMSGISACDCEAEATQIAIPRFNRLLSSISTGLVYSKMLFLSVSSFCFCKRLQEGSDAPGVRGAGHVRSEYHRHNAIAYTRPCRCADAAGDGHARRA